jgi:hypothetical protein
MQSVPITYVITDSQPLLWALKNKESNFKIAKWVIKLFELPLNFIVSHSSGEQNIVADYLSRIYMVPDELKEFKGSINVKTAVHIKSPFNPMSVLTPQDVLNAFSEKSDLVQVCKGPSFCHLNANSPIFKNLGPYDILSTCLDKETKVQVIKQTKFGLSPECLEVQLTHEKIALSQQKDVKLGPIIEQINNGMVVGNYMMKTGVLCKVFPKKDSIVKAVIPNELKNFIMAKYHFITHVGA